MVDIFTELLDENIQPLICRYTNKKANDVFSAWNAASPDKPPRQWAPLTQMELQAYCGILIAMGSFRSNYERVPDLWNSNSFPLYRATMSLNRFKAITRFLRFDDRETRANRLITDKATAITEIFELVNENLIKYYVPSDCLTVDEQLFPYRGRTRFTQYIPSKPAKYGIKLWRLCDAKSFYPLKGQIYTGKINNQRDVNQGARVVKRLVEPYKNTGRNITTDNFFTSLELAEELVQWKLSIVGTLKKNKKCVPNEFKASKKRAILSSEFGFQKNAMICSYVPKKDKSVLILSTKHRSNAVIGEQQKPEVIHFYNQTKAGVDMMDKMLGSYTTKRRTNRWPMALFYNILDVTALAAYIICCDSPTSASAKASRRRLMLTEMGETLCYPLIQKRAGNPLSIRQFSVKNAIECLMGMTIAEINSGSLCSDFEPNDVGDLDNSGRKKQRGNCYVAGMLDIVERLVRNAPFARRLCATNTVWIRRNANFVTSNDFQKRTSKRLISISHTMFHGI